MAISTHRSSSDILAFGWSNWTMICVPRDSLKTVPVRRHHQRSASFFLGWLLAF
jgi:hypothetical protein